MTTCSACEQLGQTPSPEHLASVAAFAEQVAALREAMDDAATIIESMATRVVGVEMAA